MVLNDFIMDIESGRMVSSFVLGSYVGLIGEIADLDSLVKDKKFVSDSSEVNVEFSKNVMVGLFELVI